MLQNVHEEGTASVTFCELNYIKAEMCALDATSDPTFQHSQYWPRCDEKGNQILKCICLLTFWKIWGLILVGDMIMKKFSADRDEHKNKD
jgi:hypothetical protein